MVVAGLGVQGRKRLAIAGADVVATVDPVSPEAGYRRIEDVPVGDYDAALVCTPDDAKITLVRYLLALGKLVLVE
jgi:predicted dehydrogenase